MRTGLVALAAMLCITLPTLSDGATSWSLNTWAKTAGGNIVVRGGTPQTSSNGSVFKSYTTSQPFNVTVNPNTGYVISSVNYNGVTTTNPSQTTYPVQGPNAQTVYASFAAQLLTITASAGSGGTVSPSSFSGIYYGQKPSSALKFNFTPSTGNSVMSITGVPAGTTVSSVLPAAVNTAVTVTFPTTFTFTSNVALIGTFSGPPVAVIAPPNTVLTNTSATLDGSGSTGTITSWTWSETGGPGFPATKVIPDNSSGATISFTPTQAGSYSFRLTVTGGSTAYTTLTVTNSGAAAARSQCQNCHQSNGIGTSQNVFGDWSSSQHEAHVVMCYLCHVGTNTGGHPGQLTSGTVNETSFTYTAGGASFCLNGSCHTPGVTHKTVGMACATCHNSGEIHNPNASFTSDLNVCFNCHGAVNTTHYYTESSIAANQCVFCHSTQDGHNPAPPATVPMAHFNGYTSYVNPNYAAAYVTPATQCGNCHNGGDPTTSGDQSILQYRTDWAASGHGDVKGTPWMNSASHNWKASGMSGVKVSLAGSPTDCQRCHTANGYVQFTNVSSIAPLASAAARYSEPLTCNACHNADFSLRSVTPRTGYYNYTSAFTKKLLVSSPLPDSQTSNICLGCHLGREAGVTIKAMAAATAHGNYSTSFWKNVNFLNSHYLTAGGQVFGVTGYEYPGLNYSNAVNHAYVGAGVAGPCVTCHMPNNTHTLDPSLASYSQCNSCHSGAMNSTFVAGKTADFNAALQALGTALTLNGFVPNMVAGVLSYPYFTTTNWGNKDTGPANMGAAFNYNLLVHDPGAFAHNPTYAKRLVRDSLDFLTNGSIDRSRDLTATINTLLTNSTDQANANAFLANAANGSAACSVCHSNSVDLAGNNILAAYNASLHASAPGGAACGDCHSPSAQIAHPSAAMLTDTAGVSAKCAGCHPLHPWTSAGICTTCHYGHNPKTVQMPYPHYASYTTAQYVTTNISCSNCHYTVAQPGATATFNLYSANLQWGRSGKGNQNSPSYVSYDFKTLGTASPASPANSAGNDCVRCHTTTGYQNYVSSNFTDIHAWGTSGLAPGGDRTREMIACPACHNPTPFNAFDSDNTDQWGNPVQPAFSRRVVPQVTAYYNFSSSGSGRILNTAVMQDLGESNNCVLCHTGTSSGATLKIIATKVGAAGSFWSATPFIDSHGMGSAGVLFQAAGYTYPTTKTRNYAAPSNFAHAGLDAAFSGGQGACIECHLKTDQPHLFSPISSAGNGVVSKITAYTQVCIDCHDGGIQPVDLSSPGNLDAKKQGFISSLKALSAELATKGIYFNPAIAPYFFNIADPAQQGPAGSYYTNWNAFYNSTTKVFSGSDLMGAAFNLRLLWSDTGAYTHNDYYAKRLIYDSIDFLDDGLMGNSVFTIIQNLPVSASLTTDDKTRAQGYLINPATGSRW